MPAWPELGQVDEAMGIQTNHKQGMYATETILCLVDFINLMNIENQIKLQSIIWLEIIGLINDAYVFIGTKRVWILSIF